MLFITIPVSILPEIKFFYVSFYLGISPCSAISFCGVISDRSYILRTKKVKVEDLLINRRWEDRVEKRKRFSYFW